jgi:hypothetical protein
MNQREARDRRGGQAMMRHGRRATLLVALLLLLSAATASAECAWVLWDKGRAYNIHSSKPYVMEAWQVVEAHPTLADCTSGKRRNQMVGKDDHGEYVALYECLPDTVDPRGPKTK